MKQKKIPEAFHPGEYLKKELEARGWSVANLASKIQGKPKHLIAKIIAGKHSMSPKMAKALGKALGTGAEVWINLQTVYDLTKEIQSARRKR